MNRTLLLVTTLGFFTLSSPLYAADQPNYQLSTHILDLVAGGAAPNVDVELQRLTQKGNTTSWQTISKATTDADGRIGNFLPQETGKSNLGTYKLVFQTQQYFKAKNRDTFYPFVEVAFNITNNEHYHVPISLSNFGYATYRGS